MQAYIFRAALYCTDCTKAIKQNLGYSHEGQSEYEFDSDEYPKGPFSDGGGESDSPAHCDHCNVFLENPLTQNGLDYVIEAILDNTGNREVLAEWREHYLTF